MSSATRSRRTRANSSIVANGTPQREKTHTIVLYQTTHGLDSRTYQDYETDILAMRAIVQTYGELIYYNYVVIYIFFTVDYLATQFLSYSYDCLAFLTLIPYFQSKFISNTVIIFSIWLQFHLAMLENELRKLNPS